MSPLALVTGASSGIGKAFAQHLADDGYDLIVVGRRRDRLEALATSLPQVAVQVVAADLSTDDGIDNVAELCATQPLTMLINNAGVAHYMPMVELPAAKARELVHVKVVAPTMLTRSVLPGMTTRGAGTIVNVAGMIAFSGPAPSSQLPKRAVYAGTLAHTVALSQTLSAELAGSGVQVHVVCPGVVATEFHEVQGLDLSAVPRMSAHDVVTATFAGIDLGEVVIAPGVEDYQLLEAIFGADLSAFAAQSPQLATRYRASRNGSIPRRRALKFSELSGQIVTINELTWNAIDLDPGAAGVVGANGHRSAQPPASLGAAPPRMRLIVTSHFLPFRVRHHLLRRNSQPEQSTRNSRCPPAPSNHVVPVATRRRHEDNNLVGAWWPCDQRKGDNSRCGSG